MGDLSFVEREDAQAWEQARLAWRQYYTEKRIVHQWFQADLINRLPPPGGGAPVKRVLEVGPYLGVVTALLKNVGYEVTTLDVEPPRPDSVADRHIQVDLRAVKPEQLEGQDCILCCETLEHLAWERVSGVLEVFAASETPWLVISVPYSGLQAGFQLYFNPRRLTKRSFFKFNRHRRFRCPDPEDFGTHKWEVGYRGFTVEDLRAKLEAAGYAIEREAYTSGTRAIFLVGRNRVARGA